MGQVAWAAAATAAAATMAQRQLESLEQVQRELASR
jgi:hypothetical protein